MTSQFVISGSQTLQASQQGTIQYDPFAKDGFLTTVELLYYLCKKATRELGSTDIDLAGLDDFILKEAETLYNTRKWETKSLATGWAVSPELYYLILVNVGLAPPEIERILREKFHILHPQCIRDRLIRHQLLSEFFERHNSALKFRSLLENKPLDADIKYPKPSTLSLALAAGASASAAAAAAAAAAAPTTLTAAPTAPQLVPAAVPAEQKRAETSEPAVPASQAQQPIYQQSVPTFSQPPAPTHEHKKSKFPWKKNKDKSKDAEAAAAGQPQQIQPQQVVMGTGQPQLQAMGSTTIVVAGSVAAAVQSQAESKKDDGHGKDGGSEDRITSHGKSRYFNYESYDSFKDLIAFGKRVTMKNKTFYDDKGGFDGYYLCVDGAPPNARYPVFLDKSQVKRCNGHRLIRGKVVQVTPVLINNPRNVYKIRPGESIYAIILEEIEK